MELEEDVGWDTSSLAEVAFRDGHGWRNLARVLAADLSYSSHEGLGLLLIGPAWCLVKPHLQLRLQGYFAPNKLP